MNLINAIGANDPVQQLITHPVQRSLPTGATQTAAPAADQVDLTGVSDPTNQINDIRAGKVADVRAQIDAGTYETDAKLSIATDKLLSALTSQG
jgi:negative regulator of flagellin synthesis FlgM